MPRKRSDWEKFFRALQIAGQTMGGLAQLKQYRAQQEAEEQEAKAEAEEIEAKKGFWKKRLENPLNVQDVAGIPMIPSSGKPLAAHVLSGMYDKHQRESDVRLIDTYRMLGQTPPAWLKERAKPFESTMIPERAIPKKEKPEELSEAQKNINAHVKKMLGKELTPEELIRTMMSPLPSKKDVRDTVKKEQGNWDKEVRSYVISANTVFPKMSELLDKRQGVMFVREKPEGWSGEEWKDYNRETARIHNIFGARPEMPVDPEITKARNKLKSGEWNQATYNDFIKWYQTE